MQRAVAWLLAGLMLAAAIWVMRSTQHESDGSALAAAQQPPVQTRDAAAADAAVASSSAPSAVERAPETTRTADARPASSTAPRPQSATQPERDPRRALRSLLEATSGGVSGRAAPGNAEGLDAPADPGSAGDAIADPDVQRDLARWAEENEILSEPEAKAREERERRRGTKDPEQQVLSDAALAWYLATMWEPDASPARHKALMDQAMTLVSTLPPAKKAALLEEAASALPSMSAQG